MFAHAGQALLGGEARVSRQPVSQRPKLLRAAPAHQPAQLSQRGTVLLGEEPHRGEAEVGQLVVLVARPAHVEDEGVLVVVQDGAHVWLVVLVLHAAGEFSKREQLRPDPAQVQGLDQARGEHVLVRACYVQHREGRQHGPGEVQRARVSHQVEEARIGEEGGVAQGALAVVGEVGVCLGQRVQRVAPGVSLHGKDHCAARLRLRPLYTCARTLTQEGLPGATWSTPAPTQ
mmetsp:Transcript_32210/g.70973  ORF Transcript_32210/g.70973 Transcript_32210/m.70973 type:complete len:231 (-) Transcript_32210:48-740(-)